MIKDVQAKVEALFAALGDDVVVHIKHISKAGNEKERLGTIDRLHPWGITLEDVDRSYRSVRYDSITFFDIA